MLLHPRHGLLPRQQPDRLRQVRRRVREAGHRLRRPRPADHQGGGRDRGRDRARGLRPHRDGRVRLHPLRQRDHLDGVRAPDLRRRADRRALRASLRSAASEADRVHPVRRLAQPEDRPAVVLEHLLHEHGQGHAAPGRPLPRHRERGLLPGHPGVREVLRGHVPALQGGRRPLRPRAAGGHRGGPRDPQPGDHGREHDLGQARATRARHGGAVGRCRARPGPGQARRAAHPVEDLGRLLHGVPPQAEAGRRADPWRLLRRLLRVAQGHQGLGVSGGGGRLARRCAAQRRSRSRSRPSPA